MAFGKCVIGERTLINRDCLLDNRAGLQIGSDVSVATGVKIFTQGHDIDDENFTIIGGSVIIEDHVCIFSSALIMPNIKLSKNCVVYAGSVVTKSVGISEVVGGNPAKFIRIRKNEQVYKLNSNFWFN
jgi:acetyltransferase-like isoleucine patch superfamily enzyme